MLFIQHRQRGIDTHGTDALGGVGGHIQNRRTVLLVGVSEGLHQTFSFLICVGRYALIRDL